MLRTMAKHATIRPMLDYMDALTIANRLLDPDTATAQLANAFVGWDYDTRMEILGWDGKPSVRLIAAVGEEHAGAIAHTMSVSSQQCPVSCVQSAWQLAEYLAGGLGGLRVIDPNCGMGRVLKGGLGMQPSATLYGAAGNQVYANALRLQHPEMFLSASHDTPRETFDIAIGAAPYEDSNIAKDEDGGHIRAHHWWLELMNSSVKDDGFLVTITRWQSPSTRGMFLWPVYRIESEGSFIVTVFSKRPANETAPTAPWPTYGLLNPRRTKQPTPAVPQPLRDTLPEAVAADACLALRRVIAAKCTGDVNTPALIKRASSKLSMLKATVGQQLSFAKNSPLSRLKGSREERLLLSADTVLAANVRPKAAFVVDPTMEDVLRESFDTFGSVDTQFVASRLGMSEEVAIEQAKDFLFLNSQTSQWERKSEYLAGDVIYKLDQAQSMAAFDSRFSRNVEALLAVQPKKILTEDIEVPLGAPWLPASLYVEFLRLIIGDNSGYSSSAHVTRIKLTAAWVIRVSSPMLERSAENTVKFGTNKIGGHELLELAMNLKRPEVFNNEYDYTTGKYKKVLDKEGTAAAEEKLDQIRERWAGWLREDPKRMEILGRAYARKLGCLVRKKYSGELLSYPGLNTAGGFNPRGNQRRAAERIVSRGELDDTALIAHEVGLGKTNSAIIGAVRRWQLGLTNRVIITVPKAVFGQWERAFLHAYPLYAEELLIAPEGSSGPQWREFLHRVSCNEAAFVLMTYEQFMAIPLDDASFQLYNEEEFKEAEKEAEVARNDKGATSKLVTSLKRSAGSGASKQQTRVDKLKEREGRVWTFSEIAGTNPMLVFDEFQYLKRLVVKTRMDNVAGLPTGESNRAQDAFSKMRWALDNGGKVIGLTGTPVSNTLAEVHVIMRYLQPRRLRRMQLFNFDGWASTFTQRQLSVEMDAVGAFRSVTRLHFVNVDELLEVLGECWDFAEEVPEVVRPDVLGGEPTLVEVPGSPELNAYVWELARRADDIRSGGVDPADDNMLVVTSDGRRAALWNGDPDAEFPEPVGQGGEGRRTKLDACAEKVWDVYEKHHTNKGVQLVFLDLGTPKAKKIEDTGSGLTQHEKTDTEGLYGQLKKRLVSQGILARQIAYIHDASGEEEKQDLIARVNSGDIRVLIGSTEKAGVGLNLQRLLVAIHHLDCPWRPDHLLQRNGRCVRDGNLWDAIHVFIYITAKSYDTVLWQFIQVKSTFISQLQKGRAPTRDTDDVGDLVISATTAKAIALGDTRVMDKVRIETQLTRLDRQYRGWVAGRETTEREIGFLPDRIVALSAELAGLQEAIKTPPKRSDDFYAEVRDIGSDKFLVHGNREEADAKLYATCNLLRPMLRKPVRVGQYRGRRLVAEIRLGAIAVVMDLGNNAEVVVHNIHGSGTFASLDHQIAGLEVKARNTENQIQATERRLKGLKLELEAGWRGMEEAAQLLPEYKLICEELAQHGMSDARKFPALERATGNVSR